MISHFFIDRPIFASVLSIVFVLAGIVAWQALPVEQYPNVTPPQRCRSRPFTQAPTP